MFITSGKAFRISGCGQSHIAQGNHPRDFSFSVQDTQVLGVLVSRAAPCKDISSCVNQMIEDPVSAQDAADGVNNKALGYPVQAAQ